ncbi:MAG: hypothetical protein HY701_09925 [Gemmatimonadetes bacterium]|nr:hypothetical protein [Gemmatimonadota bacterium]
MAEQDASGKAICAPFNSRCPRDGIVLLDPIDKIKDPALRRFLWEFIPAHEFPSVTIVSSRELRLILAEGALKRGARGEFAAEVNAVRALDGLTPYDPAKHSAIDPLQLLIHMRKVNLILQPQRRLLDLYRFGIRAPRWSDAALTVTAPGTVLKMGQKERRTNCYVVGTCK